MDIYFLRHASAGDKKAPTPKQDEKRPLDQKGIEQAKQMGSLLAKLQVSPDAIISSPLTRAIQTASFAAESMHYEREIVQHEALRPDASYQQFLDLLRQYGNAKSIIVVGHNPNFSGFLGQLIAGGANKDVVELKKGALAKVELKQRNRGSLHWAITPKVLEAAQGLVQTSAQASAAAKSRPKTSRK